jgi:mannose-6-phosphate isomerase-like protein (cupin superfamily)
MARDARGMAVMTILAVLLALGWASREWGHAQEKAKLLASVTLTPDLVKTQEATFEGKPTGKLAVYFDGNTAGTRNFVSGRFELRPGTEPHPPHTHPEEEILIVGSGQGEIFCDGKTTKVGPGAIMYTGPNVSHSIKNTGTEPLVFYWVKWIGVTPR